MVFVRNDLVERKIKGRRKSSKRFLEYQKKLRLDSDVVIWMNKTSKVHCKLHLKEKLFLLNIVLKIKELMLIFLNANLE